MSQNHPASTSDNHSTDRPPKDRESQGQAEIPAGKGGNFGLIITSIVETGLLIGMATLAAVFAVLGHILTFLVLSYLSVASVPFAIALAIRPYIARQKTLWILCSSSFLALTGLFVYLTLYDAGGEDRVQIIVQEAAAMSTKSFRKMVFISGISLTILVWSGVAAAIKLHSKKPSSSEPLLGILPMALPSEGRPPIAPPEVATSLPTDRPITKNDIVVDDQPPKFSLFLMAMTGGDHTKERPELGWWFVSDIEGKPTAYPVALLICIELTNRGASPLAITSFTLEGKITSGEWKAVQCFRIRASDKLFYVTHDPHKANLNVCQHFSVAVADKPIPPNGKAYGWILVSPQDETSFSTFRLRVLGENDLESSVDIPKPFNVTVRDKGYFIAFHLAPGEYDITTFSPKSRYLDR